MHAKRYAKQTNELQQNNGAHWNYTSKDAYMNNILVPQNNKDNYDSFKPTSMTKTIKSTDKTTPTKLGRDPVSCITGDTKYPFFNGLGRLTA